MKKLFNVLLLDFDGVLSDSLSICMNEINNLNSLFPNIPLVSSKEDMELVYSVKLKESLVRFGLDQDDTKKFYTLHASAMQRRMHEIEPFYDVINALKKVQIPKIIITSSYNAPVMSIIEKANVGLDELNVIEVLGKDCRGTKIDKINSALRRYNYTNEQALYVEDLVSDIVYCKEIPISICSVGYGYHSTKYLSTFSPEYICSTESDFIQFLEKHFFTI